MLFYSGIRRFANNILVEQIEKTLSGEITNELKKISGFVDEGIDILTSNSPITDFGILMNESWSIKRKLSSLISNDFIDNAYNRALNAGACGGKLLGAGGGGFMLFYVPKNKQNSVKEALKSKLFVPFSFEFTGSKIIYYSHQNN